MMKPRYRRILTLRRKKLTFDEIGKIIGTSRQRAWELYQRAVVRNNDLDREGAVAK